MTQKRSSKKQPPQPPAPRRAPVTAALTVIAICVLAAGASVTRWSPLRRAASPAAALDEQQSSGDLALTKEYVYAGGRLVASEGPKAPKYAPSGCCVAADGKRLSECRCNNKNLPKPQSLTATAESTTQVAVAWTPVGEELSYEVVRSTSVNGPFTPVSLVAATAVTDNPGGLPCTAYLYRVRSVDEYGDYSDSSNIDLATTCMFSQDPLAPGSAAIRAVYLEELRVAVEAVRAAAALPPPVWTDGQLAGKYVRAVYVQELRSQLDGALNVIGLPAPPPYTDAMISGVSVKAVHVDELRRRVK